MDTRIETILTDDAGNALVVVSGPDGYTVRAELDGEAYEFPLTTSERDAIIKALRGLPL